MDGIKDKIGKLIDEVKEKTTDFKDKAENTFEEVRGKRKPSKTRPVKPIKKSRRGLRF